MARGHVDWGVNIQQFSFGDIDMSELAVRLYSPSIWRRSGRVVFLDDFEDDLAPYILQLGGTGSSVEIDSTVSDTGTSCMKFIPGSDGAKDAVIEKRVPYLPNDRLGLEGAFWLQSDEARLVMQLVKITATVREAGILRVDPDAQQLLYKDSAGSWIKLADIHNVIDTNPNFFNLKMVVDFDEDEYVRAYLNELEYDMAGIPLFSDTITGDYKYLTLKVHVSDPSGNQTQGYCGSLIGTIDEP